MITGHKDPRKSWKIVTWMSKSGYDGKGLYTFKLSYSIVDYVKGIKQMFGEEFHLTILKFSSIYAIRIYEIVSADRFFQRGVNPEYEIDDLRYWLDCEKKYKKTNDFYKYVIETAVRDINSYSDTKMTAVTIKIGRKISRIRFELSSDKQPKGPNLNLA